MFVGLKRLRCGAPAANYVFSTWIFFNKRFSLQSCELMFNQWVAHTMIGAGNMLLQKSTAPTTLINDVCSPNGTTEAGLTQFSKHNIDIDIQKVIHAAITRSIELGKE